jgi:hypothetical protein
MGARVIVGNDVRARSDGSQAQPGAAGPVPVADPAAAPGTGPILFPRAGALPAVWAGPVPAAGLQPEDVAALLAAAPPCPLTGVVILVEAL